MQIKDLLADSDVLQCLKLFHDVEPGSVTHLLEDCQARFVREHALLLDPSVENETLFVVVSGRLEVREDAADGHLLSVIGRGACAGEMSMLAGSRPSAFVVAAEDSYLLEIPHAIVWALVGTSHGIARNLLTMLLERLHADKRRLADSVVILRQYQHRALTDALTNLSNRAGMLELFPREIRRCQRGKNAASLIMIDVDGFRELNNSRGHLAGDRALSQIAALLRHAFRPTDLIARYGGDEFAVLLPGTPAPQAAHAANRVRTRIASEPPADESLEPLTVSMGIADLADDDTLETLLHRADLALYRAKAAGRNCVRD